MIKQYLTIWTAVFFIFISIKLSAQKKDTIAVVKDTLEVHSPKKAMWLSVALPGAGQFYNHKYWKIPLIYAGGVALIYSVISHNIDYNNFKTAYEQVYYHPTQPISGYELYSKEELQYIKDQHRRYRDLSIIGLGFLYILNIVDATVDGYLFDYDISDDLSLKIEPIMMRNHYTSTEQLGFRCTIHF